MSDETRQNARPRPYLPDVVELQRVGDGAEAMQAARQRYVAGAQRLPVLADLVVSSLLRPRAGRRPTFLDIGCGHGFSGSAEIQKLFISQAEVAIGVEPDPAIQISGDFQCVHRCLMQSAPILPGSIDVAVAAFVLEHVDEPGAFWNAVSACLAPGGVFWAITVDSRHPFSVASAGMERLRIKDVYLNRLKGKRSAARYENYPTYYRANSPRQIRKYAPDFRKMDFINLHRAGQLDFYVPRPLRPLSRVFERVAMRLGFPGSILLARLEK